MINTKVKTPNFVVLRQKGGNGPIYKVTICKRTLTVLEEEVLSEIPLEWGTQDFYHLLDEGKRFFDSKRQEAIQ